MFSAEDFRRMIQAASPPLRAMMLLGCNCGFGNQDCAMLPKAAVELGRGWVDYPRPKTGIQRRCPLWPETVEAIKVAIATRPQPKDAGVAGLVFITSRGKAWAKDKDDNPISKETAKILKKLGIHRPGLNFYALRHVFQTVGEGSRDGSAVAAIMGHAPSQNDMGATYRERIDDDRLLDVTEHVRRWLWPAKQKRKAK